jgi:hypothetical protein
MAHLELLSGAARTYNVKVRMPSGPFRTGERRFEKYGKINVCFLGGSGSQAFMYETPVVNLNCRQMSLEFYGPDLIGVDKVLVRSGGVQEFNEIIVDEVRFIPSWENPMVFEKGREYSEERYQENMSAYRRLKVNSLYGGVAATLMGCGVIWWGQGGGAGGTTDALLHSEVFAVGGLFGLLYQMLLHYDVDGLQEDRKLPLALPVRLSLVIGLVALINRVTDIDPQIFIIGILGFMTNKAGLLWAGTRDVHSS